MVQISESELEKHTKDYCKALGSDPDHLVDVPISKIWTDADWVWWRDKAEHIKDNLITTEAWKVLRPRVQQAMALHTALLAYQESEQEK